MCNPFALIGLYLPLHPFILNLDIWSFSSSPPSSPCFPSTLRWVMPTRYFTFSTSNTSSPNISIIFTATVACFLETGRSELPQRSLNEQMIAREPCVVSLFFINVGHLLDGTFARWQEFELIGNDGHDVVKCLGKFTHSFWILSNSL
jgi:hypothetical protein